MRSDKLSLATFIFNGPKNAKWQIALAHGAGAGMDTPFMNAFAEGLAETGLRVARFEFPYMAERRQSGKKRPPDREPVLRETWLQVRGRVEDRPRNLHVGHYLVSPEKWLGRAFASTFLGDWGFVADKLSSLDPVEMACAHDVLKYMIDEAEAVPAGIWAIRVPLPPWVQMELADCPHRYAEFRGGTLGELFRFEQDEGL